MMQRLKNRKILLMLALPILPFVLFYGYIIVRVALSAVHNEITLQNFARTFLEYPLPPQTVEISNSSDWGILTGNGNHCDFEVTRTLRTELSEDEIRAYYRNVGFPPIVPDRSSFTGISHLDGLLSLVVRFDEPEPGLVMVSLLDGVYSGTFWDFACM